MASSITEPNLTTREPKPVYSTRSSRILAENILFPLQETEAEKSSDLTDDQRDRDLADKRRLQNLRCRPLALQRSLQHTAEGCSEGSEVRRGRGGGRHGRGCEVAEG